MLTLVPHQQARPTQLGRRSAQSDSQRPGRRAAEFAQTQQCACARTAPPARRSHSRRAIVPTAASRRCLCHGPSRLGAAGGQLLRPGDAQAEPLEAGGIRGAIASMEHRPALAVRSDRAASAVRVIGLRGIRSRRDHGCGDRFDGRLAAGPAAASATFQSPGIKLRTWPASLRAGPAEATVHRQPAALFTARCRPCSRR